MAGHGWVNPLPSGAKARCGGPPMCSVCVMESQGVAITPKIEALILQCNRLERAVLDAGSRIDSLAEERGAYVLALEQIRSSPPPEVRSWADRYSHCVILANDALNKHADKRKA